MSKISSNRHAVLTVFFCLFLQVAPEPLHADDNIETSREWTSNTGGKLHATLLSFDGRFLRVKRTSDNKIYDIPITRLAESDQRHLGPMQLTARIPIAGIPLQRWEEGNKLNQQQQDALVQRIGSLSPSVTKEWVVAASAVTGVEVNDKEPDSLSVALALTEDVSMKRSPDNQIALIMFLAEKVSVLFPDNKLNPERNKVHLNRIKQLAAKDVEVWQKAIANAIDEQLGEFQLASALASIDQLWNENELIQAKSSILRVRLSRLPNSAVKSWMSKIDQHNGTSLDAALNLVLIDTFFDQDERFLESEFLRASE